MMEGKWIAFSVVKISAGLDQSTKSPVIHLGGGGPGNPIGFWPGIDVTSLWELYQGMSVDSDRDLYIIDPRGVGQSEPALECYEFVDMIEVELAKQLTNIEENHNALEAYNACRSRLQKEGFDLAQYNSANVARDVEQLRKTLNIEQWNLYGVSYGSRYAQTIAREFPHGVESMILDAATFPEIRYAERSAQAYLQTLERLFEYCENESTCSKSGGDVRKRFWDLVNQLNARPISYDINHPYRDGRIEILLTGNRFSQAYYYALYDASFYEKLPAILQSLENGFPGEFREPLYDWLSYIVDREYADGSAIAHFCFEEAPFVDFDQAIANTISLPIEIKDMVADGLDYSRTQCQQWGGQVAEEIENQPVKTDIPTLFLHGALDPVLPVEDLDAQMQHFSQSDYQVFDDIAHGIVGVHPCGIELAREFYDNKLRFRETVTCL